MSNMNTPAGYPVLVTCASIRAAVPCYDPARYLAESYREPLQVLLADSRIPAADRVWVARKHLGDKDLRLFAVNCARRALALTATPERPSDPRFLAVCDAAEAFAYGYITSGELDAARRDAADADAADAAAYAADAADAYAAAAAYAYAAAAAAYAARPAADAAAAYAADAAAAAYAADAAAADAAVRAKEYETQCSWLISYLDGEVTE
jgi:hypothetical protein